MSWKSNKATLVTLLESMGYRKLAGTLDIKDAPETMNHKVFVAQPTGSDDEHNVTNDGYITTDSVNLEILYLTMDDDRRDDNYDDFLAVELAINNQRDLFKGWEDKRVFERLPDHQNKWVGRLNFKWGIRSCT